ncbi:hypothetical protein D3C77_667460 [compost metagenome]
MFTLGVDGNDTPENFQQAFTRQGFAGQRRTGRLQATDQGLMRLTTELLFDP